MNLKSSHLLAFDPGETTGVAEFAEGELINYFTISESDLLQLFDLNGLPWHWSADHWVVESFIARPGKTNLTSMRIIGLLVGMAQLLTVPIHYQTPAKGKGFFTDERLREFGLYVTNRHCRDAVRHGAHFLYF